MCGKWSYMQGNGIDWSEKGGRYLCFCWWSVGICCYESGYSDGTWNSKEIAWRDENNVGTECTR